LGFFRWLGCEVDANGVEWVAGSDLYKAYVFASFSTVPGVFTKEKIDTGTVRDQAIAIQSSAQPVVVYSQLTGGSKLLYRARTGVNTWSAASTVFNVDDANLPGSQGRYEDNKVALTTADLPMVVSRNDWNNNLLFAVSDGAGGWTREIAAGDILNCNCNGSGDPADEQYTGVLDLAVDSLNQAVIVYVNSTAGDVKLLKRTGSNTYTAYTLTTGVLGRTVSIAIDDADIAHIAYGITAGDLHAIKFDLVAGTIISDETVVSKAATTLDVQYRNDIVVKDNGLRAITFYNIDPSTTRAMRIAREAFTTCAEVIAAGDGLKGDLNEDCEVDFTDFADMAKDWLACNNPSGC
jgi:hypothetical protein